MVSLIGAFSVPSEGHLVRSLLLPLSVGFAVIAGLRFQMRGLINVCAFGFVAVSVFWAGSFGIFGQGSFWGNGLFVLGLGIVMASFGLFAALSTGYLRRSAHLAQGREVMLYKVFDALPIGIWVRAKSGETVFVNERWASFSDQTTSEIMTAGVTVPPVDLGAEWTELAKSLIESEDGATRYQAIELHDRHGTKCSLTLFTLRMYLDELDDFGLLCLLVDETAVRLYEEKIRVSEHRLRMALDTAEIGFWDRDVSSGAVFIDENCYRILDLVRSQVPDVGQVWTDRIHPDDRDRVTQSYEKVLLDYTHSMQIDYRIQRGTKDYLWVQDRIGVIERNAEGVPVRMMGMIEDITLRKQTEIDLQRAKDRAESASAAKGHFLATISHEIRTPLNAIIGLSSFLADTELDEEQKDLAQTIYSSGKGLLLMVNDILDFSKIEAGRLDLEEQEYPLQLCFEDSVKLFKLKASEKHLKLELHIESELPEFALGDMERLRQILHNLLANAIKFTEAGQVDVRVRQVDLSEVPEGLRPDPLKTIGYLDLPEHNYLEISVEDSGIGIPLDRQHVLFQAFSQVEPSMTRKYGGTGLGLAICKRLIDAMGGAIWLESDLGEGATFKFVVRTKAIEDEPEMQKLTRSPFDPVQRIAEQHPCDILVVGDSEEAKRVLFSCRKFGYTPHQMPEQDLGKGKMLSRHYTIVFMTIDEQGRALEMSRQIHAAKGTGSAEYVVGIQPEGVNVSSQRCKLAGMQRVIDEEPHSGVIRSVILDVLCGTG